MKQSILVGIAAAAAIGVVSPLGSAAPTLGFVETFEGGANRWTNTTRTDLTHLSSGGVGNSAYVSWALNAETIGAQGTTVFRGEQSRGASGLAFTGNYLASGADELSLFVRHDASEPMRMLVRFAGISNFPGAFFFAPGTIPANTWAKIDIAIDPSSPLFGAEGDPSQWGAIFNSVFASVANVQVVFLKQDGSTLAGPVNFGLDNVTLVPGAGSGVALLALGGMAGLRRRR